MTETADHAAEQKKDRKKKLTHPRDPAREVVETIVFVVVLVLLLKLFVTEAFVIPTGSMAETLYGYQKVLTCPKCGLEFPVNSHDEEEGNQQTGKKMPLYGFCCPNCRYMGTVQEVHPEPKRSGSGDRVLVLKPLYHIREPLRGEVVVFKWPEKPQDKHVAQNYIKRAMGFGGETLAIYRGELFVTKSLSYPADALDDKGHQLFPRPDDTLELWRPRFMYSNVWDTNPLAENFFEVSRLAGFPKDSKGGFEIIRKGEEQMLADRRIVWDNDKQPKDLANLKLARWYAEARPGMKAGDNLPWTGNDTNQATAFRHDKPELDWLRYRHLAKPWRLSEFDRQDQLPEGTALDGAALAAQQPTFIDNFLGYNAGRDLDPATGKVEARDRTGLDRLWVGDLILECKATFEAGSKVILELSKGVNRFQAIFEQGKVTLRRIGPGGGEFGQPERSFNLSPGSHDLRFANVDCRLWVWVDGKRVNFGSDADYSPPTPEQEAAFKDPSGNVDISPEGWTRTNDVLAPASIGAEGNVGVQNIKLYRDVYYTRNNAADHSKADIFYVQPGHYMCLGDNSAQSSDSRKWGLVPERLMLGKAVFIFFPILNHRIGFIK
jgi:signal peptidase I